jgi:hypothetical protein
MSGRKKEPFEIIDPNERAAVEMVVELRQLSARNQAIALMNIRKKDPQLASRLVRLLKVSLSPAHSKAQAQNGDG